MLNKETLLLVQSSFFLAFALWQLAYGIIRNHGYQFAVKSEGRGQEEGEEGDALKILSYKEQGVKSTLDSC